MHIFDASSVNNSKEQIMPINYGTNDVTTSGNVSVQRLTFSDATFVETASGLQGVQGTQGLTGSQGTVSTNKNE